MMSQQSTYPIVVWLIVYRYCIQGHFCPVYFWHCLKFAWTHVLFKHYGKNLPSLKFTHWWWGEIGEIKRQWKFPVYGSRNVCMCAHMSVRKKMHLKAQHWKSDGTSILLLYFTVISVGFIYHFSFAEGLWNGSQTVQESHRNQGWR